MLFFVEFKKTFSKSVILLALFRRYTENISNSYKFCSCTGQHCLLFLEIFITLVFGVFTSILQYFSIYTNLPNTKWTILVKCVLWKA